MISSNFVFSLTNFCVIVKCFFTNLLTLGILFSTAVRVVIVVVLKLVIPGISFLVSFILSLKVVLLAKLVISGILSYIFLI